MKTALTWFLAMMVGVLCVWSCTPGQRQVAKTVLDLVDAVCGDKDALDDCLGKMQSQRASAKAGEAASASASAAPAPAPSASASAPPGK